MLLSLILERHIFLMLAQLQDLLYFLYFCWSYILLAGSKSSSTCSLFAGTSYTLSWIQFKAAIRMELNQALVTINGLLPHSLYCDSLFLLVIFTLGRDFMIFSPFVLVPSLSNFNLIKSKPYTTLNVTFFLLLTLYHASALVNQSWGYYFLML